MIVASIYTLGSTAFVYLLPVIGDRLLHVGAVARMVVVVAERGNLDDHRVVTLEAAAVVAHVSG